MEEQDYVMKFDLFCSECDWEGGYEEADLNLEGDFVCPICGASAEEYN